MGLGETLLFYLVIGLAVAVAVHVRNSRDGRASPYQSCTAIPFWPLYLPILLSSAPATATTPRPADAPILDELAQAIHQVEAELELALSNLDGWAEAALVREADRIAELKAAWRAQAQRLRELDEVLRQLEALASAPPASPVAERSAALQRQNLERLQSLRRRGHEDLIASLESVRALASSIHVAKFTGAPLPRAEELVAEIAAAVEGLAEVGGWHHPSTIGAELAHPGPA